MADNKIGAAYVQISSKGLDKVFADVKKLNDTLLAIKDPVIKPKLSLGSQITTALKGIGSSLSASFTTVKKTLTDIGTNLRNIGLVGSGAFASLTSIIGKAVSVASPGHWERLTYSIQLVAAQFGYLLIPVVQQATEWLARLSLAIAQMTPEQKEAAVYWVKLGLVISAFGVAVLGLVGVFNAVATAVGAVLGIVSSLAKMLFTLGAAAWANPMILAVTALIVAFTLLANAIDRAIQYRNKWERVKDEESYKEKSTREQFEKTPGVKEVLDIKEPDKRRKAAQEFLSKAVHEQEAVEKEIGNLGFFGKARDSITGTLKSRQTAAAERVRAGQALLQEVQPGAKKTEFEGTAGGVDEAVSIGDRLSKSLVPAVASVGEAIKKAIGDVMPDALKGLPDALNKFLAPVGFGQPGKDPQRLEAYRPPQYMGIADAARRIQQSIAPDPGKEAERLMNEKKLKALEDIKNAVDYLKPNNKSWIERQEAMGAEGMYA